MKTKIVYVVTSLDDDIYFEQCIVSAWSARHYNPGCYIVFVCDQDTKATLQTGIRKQYSSELFDEVLVQEFQPEQSMLERSRWLKTSLRQIITGDFLFLDSDTVVCADLSEIDSYMFDLGFAMDHNVSFDKFIYRSRVIERTRNNIGVDLSDEDKYFNSGVCYAKDTPSVNQFYQKWHNLWKDTRFLKEGFKDQSSLNATNKLMNYPIHELSGDMNCQVMISMQYLHTSKVIHWFNTLRMRTENVSPLYCDSFYLGIKKEGLSDSIKQLIIHCKSSFASPSILVSYETYLKGVSVYTPIVGTHPYLTLELLYKYPFVYGLLSKVCNKLNHLLYKFGKK